MHIKLQSKETKLDFKQFVYITLPQAIYEEMMYYTKEFTTECSGCGLIEAVTHKYEDTTQVEYIVSEIFLPETQQNSCAGTEYDGKQVARIITDCVQQNKITDKVFLRFHWHSHVNMSVYHSGTDEDNYDDIQSGDWLVSIVCNKSGDIMGSVHYYNPMRFDVDSVPVYVETGEEADMTHADRNIAKVKENKDKTPRRLGYTDVYDPAYDALDLDEDLFNRGDATDAEFAAFLIALKCIDYSGQYEVISDNVIKCLIDDQYYEVFLDSMTKWQGHEVEVAKLQAQEEIDANTKQIQ